jgi:hypothetical protein
MAQIQLDRDEVGREQLPPVCMRCGQPSAIYKGKNFSWYPPWVIVLIVVALLPGAIVAMILTKRMTVWAPLCAAHKNHWLLRILLILGTLALVAALIIGSLVAASTISEQGGRHGDDLVGFVCVGGVILLVLWLIGLAVIQLTAIRPTEITDDTITLTGVSDAFVRAVEEDRDQEEEEYRARPRPRRERSDRVYDPEAPRRRPNAPPDAYRPEDE